MISEVVSHNPAIWFHEAGAFNVQLIAELRMPREGSVYSPRLSRMRRATDMSLIGDSAHSVAGLVFSKENRTASWAGKNRGNQYGEFRSQGRYLPMSMTSSISSYCRRRS